MSLNVFSVNGFKCMLSDVLILFTSPNWVQKHFQEVEEEYVKLRKTYMLFLTL